MFGTVVTQDPVLCHGGKSYAKINDSAGCLVRFEIIIIYSNRNWWDILEISEKSQRQKRRDLRWYSQYHGWNCTHLSKTHSLRSWRVDTSEIVKHEYVSRGRDGTLTQLPFRVAVSRLANSSSYLGVVHHVKIAGLVFGSGDHPYLAPVSRMRIVQCQTCVVGTRTGVDRQALGYDCIENWLSTRSI